eukprot:4256412-Amphidinium_carterae.1
MEQITPGLSDSSSAKTLRASFVGTRPRFVLHMSRPPRWAISRLSRSALPGNNHWTFRTRRASLRWGMLLAQTESQW